MAAPALPVKPIGGKGPWWLVLWWDSEALYLDEVQAQFDSEDPIGGEDSDDSFTIKVFPSRHAAERYLTEIIDGDSDRRGILVRSQTAAFWEGKTFGGIQKHKIASRAESDSIPTATDTRRPRLLEI